MTGARRGPTLIDGKDMKMANTMTYELGNTGVAGVSGLLGRIRKTLVDYRLYRQTLGELEALYAAGYRGHINFVDDNLIGNKKALKRFLPALAAWQRQRGYPFELSTEASINLADDRELLDMMSAANFFGVFVGIESPDTETLFAMQKKQNTRRSLVDSVHKLYDAGIVVIAGFIVGFDSERDSVASQMIQCIEAMSVPVCMVGLLTLLPNTQLTRRLEGEKRLLPLAFDHGDQCTTGLNFVTRRPRRDILNDYRAILAAVYDPDAYFRRLRAVCRALRPPRHPVQLVPWLIAHNLRFFGRVLWRTTVTEPHLARHFWGTFAAVAWANPAALKHVIFHIAFYLHLGPYAQFVIGDLEQQIAAIESESHTSAPALAAAPAA